MKSIAKAFSLSALVAGVMASPAPLPTEPATLETRQTSNSAAACLNLATQYKQISNGTRPYLTPTVVLACLRTVPIDTKLAAAQIDWYMTNLEWQSTLAYLKNPPSGYEMPAIDVMGSLQTIKDNVVAGKYTNEYDFEYDIYVVLASTNDGHLSMSPLLPASFRPARGRTLVSLSNNGTDSPELYFFTDLIKGINASSIVKINNQTIDDGLGLRWGGYQNLDTVYNSLLYNVYQPFGNPYIQNASSPIAWADTWTYTCSNGSSLTFDNFVVPPDGFNLSNIRSGADIFSSYILPQTSTSSTVSSKTAAPTTTQQSVSSAIVTSTRPASSSINPTVSLRSANGYPTPVIQTNDYALAGYFLENQTDTAVLNPSTFVSEARNFQDTVRKFLAMCKAAGKTRLIIDVRGNGGGSSDLGYELFRQLLPSIPLFNRQRFRTHTAFNAIGQQFSTLPAITNANLSITQNISALTEPGEADISDLNYKNVLQTPDGAPFTSWQQLNGPFSANGGNFTQFTSFNFPNEVLTLIQANGIVLSGYSNNTNVAPAVFDSKNITIFSDGICSSTCTLFSNLMIFLTNASTISVGGRESTAGKPMVVAGGVAGAQEGNFAQFSAYAEYALDIRNKTGQPAMDPAAVPLLETLVGDSPLNLAKTDHYSDLTINWRDQFMPDSQTPMQFRTVNAGCRAYYLPRDTVNVSFTWNRLAAGNYVCAAGAKAGQQTNPYYVSNPNATAIAAPPSNSTGSGSGSGSNGTGGQSAGSLTGTASGMSAVSVAILAGLAMM